MNGFDKNSSLTVLSPFKCLVSVGGNKHFWRLCSGNILSLKNHYSKYQLLSAFKLRPKSDLHNNLSHKAGLFLIYVSYHLFVFCKNNLSLSLTLVRQNPYYLHIYERFTNKETLIWISSFRHDQDHQETSHNKCYSCKTDIECSNQKRTFYEGYIDKVEKFTMKKVIYEKRKHNCRSSETD